jgi:aminomethyltransferase
MEPIEDVTPDIRTGPFHERQKAAGATFYEDMGWLWTRSFGDPVEEYWAVRRDVGLWDVSALVKWRFTGPDTLAALDRLTTRRMIDAEPGVIRYGMMLNAQGRMLDEGTNVVVARDDAMFMGNDERPAFEEHLRRETHDLDIGIENVTAAIANVSVQGPRSRELVSGLTNADLAALPWFRVIPEPVELAGVRGSLTRTGFSGELGYEFFLDPAHLDRAEHLWDAIVEAGARPFGLDAVELLRVEAGLLIQEEDYAPGETDPYDLSMDRFVDLHDHDFVGRGACLITAASPPRRFVTLVLEGDEIPEPGAAVTKDGAAVGDVRSPQRTPRFGVIALSVVDAGVANEGETLGVEGRRAVVRPVPIDDPGKRRPRAGPRPSG